MMGLMSVLGGKTRGKGYTCLIQQYFILLVVPFLVLSACRGPQKDPEAILLHITQNPVTLNPVLAEDAYSSAVSSYIYESLLERDNETLEWKGVLADSWSASSDHLRYVFYLRKNVRFHDGTPFTAKDVVFTFNKMMDPQTPNPWTKIYYENVARIYAPDDYTVVFKLKTPYFMSLGILGGFQILPEHIFSKVENFVLNEHNMVSPVGTGPYRLEQWKTGQSLSLLRNDDYYGKIPEIKQIIYKIIEEDSVALQALKKNELDLMNLTPFQWVRQSGGGRFHEQFRKEKYLATSYNYIGYNLRRFPFDDIRVRQAMTYLVNRKKILDTVLNGLAVITTGNFWVGSPQYNQDLPVRGFDPAKAKELLTEAGFEDTDGDGFLDKDGKKFTFELMIPASGEFYRRFPPVLKEDLKKAGIDVVIRQVQFQVLVENINKREFDAVILGWSIGIESDPYQLWHSSQAEKGHNFTGFQSRELDYLITRARIEFNEERRNRFYHRIHEILYENQPYTFLFTRNNLLAIHRRFQNVRIYKTGYDIKEWTIVPMVSP